MCAEIASASVCPEPWQPTGYNPVTLPAGAPSDQSSGTSSPLCDSGLHLNFHPNNTVRCDRALRRERGPSGTGDVRVGVCTKVSNPVPPTQLKALVALFFEIYGNPWRKK